MGKYKIFVCDDEGNEVDEMTIEAKSLTEAEDKASNWAAITEVNEGWPTTYKAVEITGEESKTMKLTEDIIRKMENEDRIINAMETPMKKAYVEIAGKKHELIDYEIKSVKTLNKYERTVQFVPDNFSVISYVRLPDRESYDIEETDNELILRQ